MSDEEDYILFGNQLKEFTEGDKIRKRPISVEEQIATDQNGKRRFHGAFTGGFSAGFFNTVDTPQGWTPSQFKSSRKIGENSSGDCKLQKPEDFMDDEDFGHFGFASQTLKTNPNFQSKEKGRKIARHREEGLLAPVINQMIKPTLPTVGETLLRKQGWKPGQGIGPKINKQSKQDRKNSFMNTYGDRGRRRERSDSGSEDDIVIKYKDFLFAPDELPVYVATPKENMFGIGYQGLDKPTNAADPVSNVYNIKSGIYQKKFSISGEAFGVGAYEEEDYDVYNKSDMAQYDFSLDLQDSVSSSRSSMRTQNTAIDKITNVLDGFTLSTRKSLLMKSYPPPPVPKDWTPTISRCTKKSRFSPAEEPESEVKKTTNLSSQQRKFLLLSDQKNYTNTKDLNDKANDKDTDEEIKTEVNDVPDFLTNNRSLSSVDNFKPFQSDSEKQLRYEQFLVCIRNNRRDALRILQPKTMTEWERERERVEFERAAHLYKPMNSAIASRFVSSGNINEDGALVESSSDKDGNEIDRDKKHAAQIKMFGKMTRETVEWVPARILCVRFNVKNPFNNEREPDNRRKKPIFESNQLFSLLGAGGYQNNTINDKKEKVREEVKEGSTEQNISAKIETLALVKNEPDIFEDKPPIDLFKAIFADTDTDEEVNDNVNASCSNDHFIPETMKSEKRRRESSPRLELRDDDSGRDSATSSNTARVNDDPARGIFAGINFDKFAKRRRKTPPPVIPMKALTSRPKTILDRSIRNILGIKSGDISDDEYGPIAPPVVPAPAKSIVISSDDSSLDWEEKDKSKKKKKRSRNKKEKKSKKKKKKQRSSKYDSD